QNAEILVPEAKKQKRTEQPFGNAQEPTGAADAECGVEPEDQWPVADIGDQHLGLVFEPFLVAEEQEDDDHRCADDVVVEVFSGEPAVGEAIDDEIHRTPPSLWTRRRVSPIPQPGGTLSDAMFMGDPAACMFRILQAPDGTASVRSRT